MNSSKTVAHGRLGRSARRAMGATILAAPLFAGATWADDEAVQIRILAVDAFANTWQTQLVPKFEAAYPDIEITIDGVTGPEMLAKIMLDAISPDPEYDIVFADDPWVPQLAEIGALIDLKGEEISAITDEDYDWSDFHPTPLAAGQWEGTQYAVPVRSNMLLMFYNRDLYESAGLPAPTPNLTWDEFFDQAEALVQDTDGDGDVDAWAISTYFIRDSLTPTIWQAILNAHGGSLLDAEGAPAFNNDIGATALSMHREMLDYAPPGALGHGFTESLQAFRQGRVAVMFQWGSVFKSTAVDQDTSTLAFDDVGIQVMPVGSERAGTHRGIWNAAIGANSPNVEEAWTFLQWLTSREGELVNASTVGSFPARRSTLTSEPPEPWLEPVYAALLQAYEVAAEGEMWRIRSPKSDAVQQILADEVARGIAGQASDEEALRTAADKAARVLN